VIPAAEVVAIEGQSLYLACADPCPISKDIGVTLTSDRAARANSRSAPRSVRQLQLLVGVNLRGDDRVAELRVVALNCALRCR
jgi:hypothetical protein